MVNAGFSSFFGNAPFQMVAEDYLDKGFHLEFGDDLRLQRLISGHYQIVGVTMNSILMNLGQIQRTARVVYAYVRAAGEGSDLIVCRGPVCDVEHLARLRIGVQRGSLEHFLFERLFFSKRTTHAEYKWMPRSEYLGSISKGEIDAAIFCDPALSQLLADDSFKTYGGDMREITLTAIGVIAARKELIAEQPDELREFVSVLSRGIDAVRDSDDTTLTTRAGRFFSGIDRPRETMFSRVAFLNLSENQKLFSPDEPSSLFNKCSDWLGFLKESEFLTAGTSDGLDPGEILDSRVIRSLGG
jgi:hypothetical protein